MRSARGGGDAEPPQIIKNIIWLLQNWRSQTDFARRRRSSNWFCLGLQGRDLGPVFGL